MFPWLWFWSPQFHFPWSGSVRQRIDPITNWFFDSIPPAAGDGQIEKRAFEVASYGRQLGLIIEVLVEVAAKQAPLSPDAAGSLERLKAIQTAIEKIKRDERRGDGVGER
jgi:hypothetical protein